jgi:hypothetical protein
VKEEQEGGREGERDTKEEGGRARRMVLYLILDISEDGMWMSTSALELSGLEGRRKWLLYMLCI